MLQVIGEGVEKLEDLGLCQTKRKVVSEAEQGYEFYYKKVIFFCFL